MATFMGRRDEICLARSSFFFSNEEINSERQNALGG